MKVDISSSVFSRKSREQQEKLFPISFDIQSIQDPKILTIFHFCNMNISDSNIEPVFGTTLHRTDVKCSGDVNSD
jgi:hypothetical protein